MPFLEQHSRGRGAARVSIAARSAKRGVSGGFMSQILSVSGEAQKFFDLVVFLFFYKKIGLMSNIQ